MFAPHEKSGLGRDCQRTSTVKRHGVYLWAGVGGMYTRVVGVRLKYFNTGTSVRIGLWRGIHIKSESYRYMTCVVPRK